MWRLYALCLALLASLTGTAVVDEVDVDSDPGQFGVWVEEATDGGIDRVGDTSQPIGEYHQQPACVGVCTGELTCPDGTFKTHSWYVLPNGDVINNAYWCPSEAAPPQVTESLVATAFQRIPLPPSTFQIQPPGGRTLVNFETNFFTRSDQTLNRTVRLLGQRVDLRIEAHSYTWHFDDGETITTSEPGAPYPRLQITHNYLQTGRYGPALDTTWVADYRVNGGAWRPVPGSVTIEGAAAQLRAIEARPTLVGYGS
ncbi:hypothetical protein DJ010_19250 [Nocardioides silvaticus]|uniref:PKD domain-containing protein n=1 Tax=Nocardioides silvaticus TaxID=2201891 RepID=A0A316TE15_9ACTN|nr:PKD domain-containing protein [Nocardioides silvaticus]PWN01299.1 hypothetical protein DJ010_19250 [Nocardioides silvaticus]